jgi:hypothetical protein
MGRYWHFVVLEGNSYTVHPGLNAATLDDLTVIFGTLKHTKILIDALLTRRAQE